jgi:hypothetical protein
MNVSVNFQVSQNVWKLSSGYTTGGLSSSAQLHRVSLVRDIPYRIITVHKQSCHISVKGGELVDFIESRIFGTFTTLCLEAYVSREA